MNNRKAELRSKLEKINLKINSEIKPLLEELRILETEEYVGKYYYDVDDNTSYVDKYYFVKTFSHYEKDNAYFKCAVIDKLLSKIYLDVIHEYNLYYECSKEEFDNIYNQTLKSINEITKH